DDVVARLARVDWLLILLVTAIAAIGAGMLYSAADGHASPWAGRHAVRYGAGVVQMLAIAAFGARRCLKLAYPAYAACFLLLVMVEVAGTGDGSTRWIDVGFMRLQPSELMKVALVLALARLFHDFGADGADRLHVLAPALLMIAAPTALVLKQPDLGTAVLIAAGGGALLFFAGAAWWKFGLAGAAAAAAGPIAWSFLHDYQKARILTFLEPERDPLGSGYHILQSMIALGSGGAFGKGWLQGTQAHLAFLPEKHTDFVFTMLGEELGLAGGLFVLLLFALVIFRLYQIGLRAESRFGRLTALGVATMLFLYVFVNMAMVMGLAPVVGVPLPFVSYGGTAMLTLQLGFGLALAVAVDRSDPLEQQHR
ncbi:MAG: rod shape-determining protein RodA, partial [Alphaproteobacteria bacterium]